MGLRDKQDSARDTEAVSPGTDSFAAYGVQRGSVLTPDRVQCQVTPEHRSEGGAYRSLLPCGGLIHFLLFSLSVSVS